MHPNESVIHEYVDEALDARERAEVDQHLAGCADCRQLVADLREIRLAVSGLERREPPVRVWSRIERAIKLEATERSASERSPQNPQNSFSLRVQRVLRSTSLLTAAAALILATVVGLQFRSGRQAAAPPADGPQIAAPDTAQAVEAELRAAEEHYTKAITGLERITRSEQNTLDPGTSATLQKNLAVIDQAISESRAALRTQPASEPAQASLVENFKAKIGLLEDTVSLINEMRKGNEAGAARIVSGLKHKGN